MRSFLFAGLCTLLLSLLPNLQAAAQSTAPDSLLTSALLYAKGVYHDKINERAGIFSGPQYVKTADAVVHPFFQSVEAQKGQLQYEGLLFTNVDMLYDTQADQVIVKYPNSALYFSLLNERVAGFTLNQHTFQWLSPDSSATGPLPAGFYDVLLDGTVGVAAKRIKMLTKIIVDKKTVNKYTEKDDFYLIKDNVWYPIKAKKDIFMVFPESKRELSKHMKKEKLKFNKVDKEKYIMTVAQYFNKNK